MKNILILVVLALGVSGCGTPSGKELGGKTYAGRVESITFIMEGKAQQRTVIYTDMNCTLIAPDHIKSIWIGQELYTIDTNGWHSALIVGKDNEIISMRNGGDCSW